VRIKKRNNKRKKKRKREEKKRKRKEKERKKLVSQQPVSFGNPDQLESFVSYRSCSNKLLLPFFVDLSSVLPFAR
jgi:hypothetical protein